MPSKRASGKTMKREYFDIILNGSVVATRFAWNTAIRAVEQLVRERARKQGVVYRLVDSGSGYRTWQSAHETLQYTIKLRTNAV